MVFEQLNTGFAEVIITVSKFLRNGTGEIVALLFEYLDGTGLGGFFFGLSCFAHASDSSLSFSHNPCSWLGFLFYFA